MNLEDYMNSLIYFDFNIFISFSFECEMNIQFDVSRKISKFFTENQNVTISTLPVT